MKSKESLIQLLSELPLQIKEEETKLMNLSLKKIEFKRAIEHWENKEMIKISEAKEEGKSKFSNETLRKAELSKRKQESETYQHLSSSLLDIEKEEKQLQIEFNYLDRKFKALRKIADLIAKGEE
jgi:hypothetical protein